MAVNVFQQMLLVQKDGFAEDILHQRLGAGDGHICPGEHAFLLYVLARNFLVVCLLLFHLGSESTVLGCLLLYNAEAFQTVRDDERMVLVDACRTDEKGREDDAQCQIFGAEESLAVGEEGGEECLGSIAEGDACRKDEQDGCLPPRHTDALGLLLACDVQCHRQEEERHAEVVIYKCGEQYVGKGEKKTCEQIAVTRLQLHDFPEYPTEKQGGVESEERHQYCDDDSGAVGGGQVHQPPIEQR